MPLYGRRAGQPLRAPEAAGSLAFGVIPRTPPGRAIGVASARARGGLLATSAQLGERPLVHAGVGAHGLAGDSGP